MNMNSKMNILIVEDEMLLAAHTALKIKEMGHNVYGIFPRGEEAVAQVEKNPPDIILMDIQLNGKLNGIETALEIQKMHDIPIIYLTANTDKAHFDKAKETHPYAFVSKPAKKLELQRAIDVVIQRIEHERQKQEQDTAINNAGAPFMVSDCVYVRDHDKMVKVNIEDIYYVEADRNYCRIHTKVKQHMLVVTLKEMDQKLPPRYFLRIHRSFIVNLMHIDEVAANHIVVDKRAVPMSKPLKEELLKRLQTI